MHVHTMGLSNTNSMLQSNSHEPYRDTPISPRASSPALSSRPSTPEAQTSIPAEPPSSIDEPYRDDPSAAAQLALVPSLCPQPYRAAPDAMPAPVFFPPYSDSENDDDVPLAHLYPYPTEAPPAYNVVVGQSYRDTLISHIPSGSYDSRTSDEEAVVGQREADDLRFSIERIVAMIVVALVLLLITGIFVWQIIIIKSLPMSH